MIVSFLKTNFRSAKAQRNICFNPFRKTHITEIQLVTYSPVSVGHGRKTWKQLCRDEPHITEIQLVAYRGYI